MAYSPETLKEKLFNAYGRFYDMEMLPGSAPMIARGVFHVHDEQYFLIQKANAWSADRYEYLWVYEVPVLTEELFRKCTEESLALGSELIKPDSKHMSSYIVSLFICGSVDEAAAKALKRYRMRKDFRFGLNGWMEAHAAAIDLGKESVTSNPDGRRTREFVNNILHPRKRRFSFLFNKR